MFIQTNRFTLDGNQIQLAKRTVHIPAVLKQLLALVYEQRQVETAALARTLGISPGRGNTLAVNKKRLSVLFGFEVLRVVRGVWSVPTQIRIVKITKQSTESVAAELAALHRKTDQILKLVKGLVK